MNILVDENIPRQTVRALRALGHRVSDVRGTAQEGGDEETLWQRAVREKALLITTDKGFTRKYNEPHWGILVVRLRQPNRLRIHTRVLQALDRFADVEWPGLLVVMRDAVQSVLRAERREG